MMAAPEFRRRLALLLGMLGSDHDGERSNAGRLAERLVRQQGLTWPQVIDGPPVSTGRTDSSRNREEPRSSTRDEFGLSDLDKVRAALAHLARLNEWEQGLVQSIQLQLRRHRRLTPKQEKVLNCIYRKVTT